VDRRTYFALLLFAATGLTIWAFGLIIVPFLVPIAWAMCLATVTAGMHARIIRWTRRPALAAFLMTLSTCLLILLPVVMIGSAIVKQALDLRARVDASTTAPLPSTDARPPSPAPPPSPTPPPPADAWDDFFRRHARLDEMRRDADAALAPLGTTTKALADEALTRIAQPVATGTLGVLQGLLTLGFGFLVMLATLYVLYRDGAGIRAFVVDVVPLTPQETGRILDTLRETAFAAVVGGLVTAMIQGALGGVAFAIVGVSGALFWGFVMAVLSLLPVGGSAFVWGPTAVYFFLGGPAWKGWFLLLWGVIVIGSSDSLLRPWLMRRAGASTIHPLLLFFAILSGIGLFGVSGIVFGPLLIAFVQVVVRIYRDHFGKAAVAVAGTGGGEPPGTSASAPAP
jgi:predicted PurR-regulated permease PerM